MIAFRLLLVALVACVALPAESTGQPRSSNRLRSPLPFSADAVSFRDADGDPRTELMVTIPLSSLHFEKRAEGPGRTRVRVTAIFYDEDGRQITGDDWSYHDIPGSTRREENDGKFFSRRYAFRLPSGKIRAKVGVEEPDTGIAAQGEFEFEIPRFSDEHPSASDLVFGVCSDLVVAAPPDEFVGSVLPHPSRRYGDDTPAICVYAELYDPLSEVETFEVRYRVKSGSGRTLEDTTWVSPREGATTPLVLRPRFTGLSLGSYELTLEVKGGGEKTTRTGIFEVDETRISFIRDSEKLRTVIEYIATNEERWLLDGAPDDSLAAYWQQFWRRRDPTPDTRHNEAMLEFLRRVDYAGRNYGVLEPGWRSDRGRIHIKYGSPDQVERVVNDAYRPPTIIWYYYERNLTFVFQDLDGFGRYRLVGPNRN